MYNIKINIIQYWYESSRPSEKAIYHEHIQQKNNKKSIKATAFDEKFDNDEVTEYLDLKSAKLRYPVQRLSIDFTKHMIEAIDIEAAKIGVTRTALIKIWVAERLNKR